MTFDPSKHPRRPAGTPQGGEWFDAETDNLFARMQGFKTNGDVVRDWLKRTFNGRGPDANGKYVFYHGTPKSNKLDFLRAGSLLETDPESAAHLAGRDRGLTRGQVVVHRVLVGERDIHVGHWASLRGNHKLTGLLSIAPKHKPKK